MTEMHEVVLELNRQFLKASAVLDIMRTMVREAPQFSPYISTSPYMNGKNCGWHLTYYNGQNTNAVNIISHHSSGNIVLFYGKYEDFHMHYGHVLNQDIGEVDFGENVTLAAYAAYEALLEGKIQVYHPSNV